MPPYPKTQKKPKLWTSKQADDKFSVWIRERDGQRCQICGKTTNLTNSHYWGRVRSSVRYSPDNCITLCWMPCHVSVEKEKQGKYTDLMIKRLGKKAFDDLKKLANTFTKRSDAIRELMTWLT